MAKTTIKLSTIEALQQKLADKRAKKNFASRKTHTKKYAEKHNLFLPAGETSVYGDNIDWTAAIRGKYNVDFDTWSNIHWSSKPVTTRNLKSMTEDELKTYKKIASRKSRFKSQLECADISLTDFLAHIEVDEDVFFSDEYQADNKVTKENRTSIYNLEYYIENGTLEALLS